MRFLTKLKRELKRGWTIICIPGSSLRPLKVHFSLAFITFLIILWFGITFWAIYISTKHIDYVWAEASKSILKAKMSFLMDSLNKTQNYVSEVKELEYNLKELLNMKDKDLIIKTNVGEKWERLYEQKFQNGKGGPSALDKSAFQKIITDKISELTIPEINQQISYLKQSLNDTIIDFKEILQHITQERKLYRATPILLPHYGRLTSHYGMRLNPFSGKREFHSGLDIAGSYRDPIRVTADGVVSFVGWSSGLGKVIVVNHGHGFQTIYGHCSKTFVKPDEKVKRGQIIALIGTTGLTTGPHVHYEVWRYGNCVNPLSFVESRRF